MSTHPKLTLIRLLTAFYYVMMAGALTYIIFQSFIAWALCGFLADFGKGCF